MKTIKLDINAEGCIKNLKEIKNCLTNNIEPKCPYWRWYTSFRPDTNMGCTDCKICVYLFPKIRHKSKGSCPLYKVYSKKYLIKRINQIIAANIML